MACLIRSELLCAVLLLAGAAHAASASETAARAAALEAKKAFDLGDFAKAIEQYEAAYKLKAAPGLLFNLGQSHRRAGHFDRATFYFRRYLETNPPAAQAKATEDVLAEVEAQLAGKQADQTEQQRKEAERLALEDQRKHAAAEQQRELELEKARLEVVNATERKLALEAALKQQPPPLPVYQRWWFWTAIGVGVAGAAVTATAIATAPQPIQTTFPDINAR
jgi:tetratricopeptide (TPR) repeat protein